MADQAAHDAPAPARGGFRGRGNRGGRGGKREGGGKPALPTPAQPDAEPSGPPPQHQTKPVKPGKPVLSRLPAPTRQAENNTRQKTVSTEEDSAFKESVFGEERRLKPATREVDFFPSSTGYTELVNDMYLEYKNEKSKQMTKEFPVKLLRYYCACLYWLRVLGIKYKTTSPLTEIESQVYQALEYRLMRPGANLPCAESVR